ncbi:MAG: hypothetical protein ACYC0V_07460 [Armatimonadota bacterium]
MKLPLAILMIIVSLAGRSYSYYRVHPENAHYFQDTTTGKSVILVGYGGPAPTSKAIDYISSINRDAKEGMIYGRVWHLLPWEYGNAIWPWKRSNIPGAGDGLGNKYNLNIWNNEYWLRMRDCLNRTNKAKICSEVFLFEGCGMEKADRRWHNNPWASDNNINKLETMNSHSSGTPDFYNYDTKPNLLAQQERYVNKLIDETIAYPNVIYEIENEHDSGNEPAWTTYWSKFVKNRISLKYPNSPRLISQTTDPDVSFNTPTIDIVNYHSDSTNLSRYNDFLEGNWSRNKAMNVDELANGEASYDTLRRVCWIIIISGGHFHLEDPKPSAKPYLIVRNILSFLNKSKWDFVHAAPDKKLIGSGDGYCMANPGIEYVFYFPSGGEKWIKLEANQAYAARWWNPRTGGFNKPISIKQSGDETTVLTPDADDWMLYVVKVSNSDKKD